MVTGDESVDIRRIKEEEFIPSHYDTGCLGPDDLRNPDHHRSNVYPEAVNFGMLTTGR